MRIISKRRQATNKQTTPSQNLERKDTNKMHQRVEMNEIKIWSGIIIVNKGGTSSWRLDSRAEKDATIICVLEIEIFGIKERIEYSRQNRIVYWQKLMMRVWQTWDACRHRENVACFEETWLSPVFSAAPGDNGAIYTILKGNETSKSASNLKQQAASLKYKLC